MPSIAQLQTTENPNLSGLSDTVKVNSDGGSASFTLAVPLIATLSSIIIVLIVIAVITLLLISSHKRAKVYTNATVSGKSDSDQCDPINNRAHAQGTGKKSKAQFNYFENDLFLSSVKALSGKEEQSSRTCTTARNVHDTRTYTQRLNDNSHDIDSDLVALLNLKEMMQDPWVNVPHEIDYSADRDFAECATTLRNQADNASKTKPQRGSPNQSITETRPLEERSNPKSTFVDIQMRPSPPQPMVRMKSPYASLRSSCPTVIKIKCESWM